MGGGGGGGSEQKQKGNLIIYNICKSSQNTLNSKTTAFINAYKF